MKKYASITIAILIMAALGVGYYYYLSNRQPRQDATQQSLVNEQLAQLKTKNIEQNYPESVKEVSICLCASVKCITHPAYPMRI